MKGSVCADYQRVQVLRHLRGLTTDVLRLCFDGRIRYLDRLDDQQVGSIGPSLVERIHVRSTVCLSRSLLFQVRRGAITT